MGSRFHLAAGPTGTAGVRLLIVRQRFAKQRLRQAQGEKALPNPIIAVEKVGMRNTVLQDRGPEQRFRIVMSDDINEGHWDPVMREVRGCLRAVNPRLFGAYAYGGSAQWFV
jgi:hypothetical protein